MNLDINPETVYALIQVARQFHNRDTLPLVDGAEDEEEDPIDETSESQLVEGDGLDPAHREFDNLVSDLEPDQQHQLMALFWLGRGDFELEDWHGMVEQAAEQSNRRTADHLLGDPQIADYLYEGLSLLGYDGE